MKAVKKLEIINKKETWTRQKQGPQGEQCHIQHCPLMKPKYFKEKHFETHEKIGKKTEDVTFQLSNGLKRSVWV